MSRPPCCNPAHLFLGTPLDNNADKVAKGRHAIPWGMPLARSRQTVCKQGHPLEGDNLWVYEKTGHRRCRCCAADASRRNYGKNGRTERPLVVCVDCGRLRPHRAHGRCAACDQRQRRRAA